MGPQGSKEAAEARKLQLQDAIKAQQAGETLSASQQELIKSAAEERESRKSELISSGIGAAGGAASGALQALLTKPAPGGKSAIPGGGSNSVPSRAVPDAAMSRPSISSEQRPSLALEMLRRGGYQ